MEMHQQILSIPRKIDSQKEGDRFQRESSKVEEEGGLAAVREVRRSDAGTLRDNAEGDAWRDQNCAEPCRMTQG